MRSQRLTSLLFLSLIGCSAAQQPAPEAPAQSAAPEPQDEEEIYEQPAEEKEAEERAAKLANDRAQMQGRAQVELRRWTPELRKATQALADRKYKSLQEAIPAVLKGGHRTPESPERDSMRHPLETLAFFGMTPQMRVIEYGPGEGWYTEILAPTLAAEGKLLVTTADPDGPKDDRQTFYAERLKLFLAKSPEAYGKIEPIIYDPENPQLKLSEPVNMALVIRGVHGWVRNDQLLPWLETLHSSLAEGGILGIVQHRAQEGADPKKAAEKGYVPQAWLIEQVESAGFKLDGQSEINANPKDTKEYPEGVWSLPPTLRLGETDREKYTKIGESDRMTLRFVKTGK